MCKWLFLLCLAAGVAVGQTIAAPAYVPLTSSQRFQRYWDETLKNPGLYAVAGLSALAGQVAHDPPEWGQGLGGYAHRTASEMGILLIQGTVHEAGAAALGYDPRYQTCGCTGLWKRTGHALKWSFLTRTDTGRTRLDLPSLAGAYGAGMLAMYWYPNRFNPLSDGVRIGTQEFGYHVGADVLREFAPELKRFFRIKK